MSPKNNRSSTNTNGRRRRQPPAAATTTTTTASAPAAAAAAVATTTKTTVSKAPRTEWNVTCSHMASRIKNPIRAVAERGTALLLATTTTANIAAKPLIKLSVGDPTQDKGFLSGPRVNVTAVQAVVASGDYNGYLPASGSLEARQAVSEFWARNFITSPEEGKEALMKKKTAVQKAANKKKRSAGDSGNHEEEQENAAATDAAFAAEVEAVAVEAHRRKVASIPREHVVLSSGGSHAIQLAFTAIASAGDNILLPTPCFPHYITMCDTFNITKRFYTLDPARDWEVDLKSVAAKCDEKTKLIVVTNPSNPCGTNFSRRHVGDILALAESLKVPIFSDEIYAGMVFQFEDEERERSEALRARRAGGREKTTTEKKSTDKVEEEEDVAEKPAALAAGVVAEDDEDTSEENATLATHGADGGSNNVRNNINSNRREQQQQQPRKQRHVFTSMADFNTTVPRVILGGTAKQFAVPGWRLGWLIYCSDSSVAARNRNRNRKKKSNDDDTTTATAATTAVGAVDVIEAGQKFPNASGDNFLHGIEQQALLIVGPSTLPQAALPAFLGSYSTSLAPRPVKAAAGGGDGDEQHNKEGGEEKEPDADADKEFFYRYVTRIEHCARAFVTALNAKCRAPGAPSTTTTTEAAPAAAVVAEDAVAGSSQDEIVADINSNEGEEGKRPQGRPDRRSKQHRDAKNQHGLPADHATHNMLYAHMPQGAMYVMVKVNTPLFQPDAISDDNTFFEKLLAEEHVQVMPGSAFRRPGYVRIVITRPEEVLAEAVDRMAALCQRYYSAVGAAAHQAAKADRGAEKKAGEETNGNECNGNADNGNNNRRRTKKTSDGDDKKSKNSSNPGRRRGPAAAVDGRVEKGQSAPAAAAYADLVAV